MKGELRKQIGLYGLTMVAVGSCIGSGIFITPSEIARQLPDPVWIFGVWLLGGLVAVTGSLTFAELGAQFPKAGGVYIYIRESFGQMWAFMYGWSILSVITSGALAALSLTFARYVGTFVPLDRSGMTIVGIAAIGSLTVVNAWGVRYGELFTNVFTTLKLLGIAMIVLIGIFLGASISDVNAVTIVVEQDAKPFTGAAVALAMIGVLWSFGGWHHASYLSGETKHAVRTVPRAMILGASIVTIMYLLANLGYLRLISIDEIAQSNAVAAKALSAATPAGGKIIAVLIAISTLGSIGIFTMSAPRIYFAMAQDGRFFKALAKIHPRTGTPVNAILLQSVWAVFLLLIWGQFEKVITSVVFLDWVFMILAAVSIFFFRKRAVSSIGFRTPLYPVIPLIFIGVSLWFVIYTLVGRPEQALWALGLLALGLPIYFLAQKRKG